MQTTAKDDYTTHLLVNHQHHVSLNAQLSIVEWRHLVIKITIYLLVMRYFTLSILNKVTKSWITQNLIN